MLGQQGQTLAPGMDQSLAAGHPGEGHTPWAKCLRAAEVIPTGAAQGCLPAALTAAGTTSPPPSKGSGHSITTLDSRCSFVACDNLWLHQKTPKCLECYVWNFLLNTLAKKKLKNIKRTDETNVAEAPYWNRVTGGDSLYNSLLLRMIESV